MKNLSYVINGIIATAVIAFSILLFSSCKDAGNTGASGEGSKTSTEGGEFNGATLPIAYVRIDSLLANYEFSKDVNEHLMKKNEDMRVTLNQKGKKLEKDMGEFQRKAQNNAFLSQERFDQEQNRLMKQQQDLEQMSQRLQNEWMQEQQKENMKLADSIRSAVKLYNEKAKFEMIFNMNELDNIILANPKYDITQEVLSLLNSRYKPEAKK